MLFIGLICSTHFSFSLVFTFKKKQDFLLSLESIFAGQIIIHFEMKWKLINQVNKMLTNIE